jgi:C1A family cysteine protease
LSTALPVQNQGSCGSCWAFAATAAVEIQSYITNPSSVGLLKLSEQLIIDCNSAGSGCGGGSPLSVITWLISSGTKEELATDYPYKGTRATTCGIVPSLQKNVVVKTYTFTKTSGGVNVQNMINALSLGPVVTYIDGGTAIFQGYKSGIINNTCCYTTINHAVLTVGWGINGSNQSYWIIRNSWGSSWGELGYVRVAILTNGMGVCGNQY